MDDFKPVSDEPQQPESDAVPFETRMDDEGKLQPVMIVETPVGEYKPKSAESVWERLRRFLGIEQNDPEGFTRRLLALDQAIREMPDAPANYVLRGELHLMVKQYAQARDDFQHGLELASAQVERNDWGIVAQALQDRALKGKERAERALKRAGTY